MRSARLRCITVALLRVGMFLVCTSRTGAQSPASAQALKQEQPPERNLLIRQVEDLRRAGRFDEAVPVAEYILDLERRAGGEWTADGAEALSRLAELHELRGDWARAIARRKEALTVRDRIDGRDHWRTNDARLSLAFAEKVAGLAEVDRARVKAALQKEEEATRSDAQGKYAEAEGAAVDVIGTYRELIGSETAEVARVWHLVGRMRLGRKDARGAREANERALAIRRTVLPANHPDLGRSLFNLGQAERASGNDRSARKVFEEAVRTWRASMSPGDTLMALALTTLGQMQIRSGELDAAETNLREALAIRRNATSTNLEELAQSLFYLGLVQEERSDFRSARTTYKEGLDILRKKQPRDDRAIASFLNNLGVVQRNLSEYAAAKAIHEEELAIRRKLLSPDDPGIATSLNNLGLVQQHLGELQTAKKSFEGALAIRRKALPRNHADVARSLHHLGTVQYELKEYGAAKRSHEEALVIFRQSLSPGHWLIARSLDSLGDVNYEMHELLTAEKCYEEALAIRRKAAVKDNENIARNLYNIGNVRSSLGDYDTAKRSQEEALTIGRKALRRNDPRLAQILLNLGIDQQHLREYVAARKSLEESLAIFRKVVPSDTPCIIANLIELGNLYYLHFGDYAAAKAIKEEAVTICRQAFREGDPRTANCLNGLGDVLLDLGVYATAKQNHEEALAICRKALPPGHWISAQSLRGLGLAQGYLREYADAKKNLEEALAISRNLPPEDPKLLHHVLMDLGDLRRQLGEYTAARKDLEEALSISRKVQPPDDLNVAQCLNLLGKVQGTLREWEAARRSLAEALAIKRKVLDGHHPVIADTLIDLGIVRCELGQYAGAKANFREALDIYRNVLPINRACISRSLDELGLAQWRLREYAAAKASFQEAIAIGREGRPQDDSQIAGILNNLGLVLRDLREYDAARKSHEESLDLARKAKEDRGIELSLFNLARLSLISGIDVEAAAGRLGEAIDLAKAEQLRQAVAQAEREQFASAESARFYLALLIDATIRTRGDLDTAYDRVLSVKGSVTAYQLRTRLARDTVDPDTFRLLNEFRKVTERLVDLSADEHPFDRPRILPDTPTLIRSLSDERARLERQLSERSAVYRASQKRAQVGIKEVRDALPEDTAIIDVVEYVHDAVPAEGGELFYERRMAAFVVRPDRQGVILVPLGPSEAQTELINRWRNSYGVGKGPSVGERDAGDDLRKRLWEPLAQHLRGIKVVLISPDGSLNGLPWAALPGSRPGTFLVHEYAFVVVPVPQLLPELLQGQPRSANELPSLLLAGGIDFGEWKGRDSRAPAGNLPPVPVFGPLAGTESEVNELDKRFQLAFPRAPVPHLLRKDAANKQAILDAAPAHRFVHLATHGYFAAESERSAGAATLRADPPRGDQRFRFGSRMRHPGLLSGLVFAGVNHFDRRPAETILTALEVAELGLVNVNLVALSACDTGRGLVAGGEGVLGLQRAFQLAGARTTVTSLWKVDDDATQALMSEFYRNLWQKKLPKLEALRQAQLTLLRDYGLRGGDVVKLRGPGEITPVGRAKLAQAKEAPRAVEHELPPFYWAAFVLSGDWR